jgi:hypothetical protein
MVCVGYLYPGRYLPGYLHTVNRGQNPRSGVYYSVKQCWGRFLESGTDAHWLSTRVYTHLSIHSQMFKNQFWYLTMVLKEPAQEPSFFVYSLMKTTDSFKGF